MVILAFLLLADAPHALDRPSDTPPRTVAIGDIHGDFDSFVTILRHAGLIDEGLRWSGGTATLVQTGDFTDRGASVRQVMDLLMSLEDQAALTGGRVVVLLGNHEVMNLMREVRDVAPTAYHAFTDEHSDARYARAYREYVGFMAARAASLGTVLPVQAEEEWLRSRPPGFAEYADAFDADGVYGRWLRSKMVVKTLGDTVFLHAGINPAGAPYSLEDINRRVRNEIQRFDEYRRYLIDRRIILPSFTLGEIIDAVVAEITARKALASRSPDGDFGATSPGHAFDRRLQEVLEAMLRIGTWDSLRADGPLWFRGFATWSSEEGALLIRKLLEKYRVAQWVVGHTIPSSMRITPRFSSRVFLIDTGMLSSHYPGGRGSALEIRDGRFTAIALDQQTILLEADNVQPPHPTPSR